MASQTLHEAIAKIGRRIGYSIEVYELILNGGYKPDDAETEELLYLRDRMTSLFAKISGTEDEVSMFKPRWLKNR